MKILSPLALVLLSIPLAAQSPLVVQPAGTTYGWVVPPPDGQTFFDLTVNTTITLQAIETPTLTSAGTIGTLEVYLTNPGITTYVGNTAIAANWTLAATGLIEAKGSVGSLASLTATSCQTATGGGGLVLQPGSRGVAIRYVGVTQALQAVTTVGAFSNAELTLSGGAIQYNGFVSALTGPPPGFAGWSWWGRINYANGVAPHACAVAVPYGTGCYNRFGSFYQEFNDSSTPSAAAAAAAALNGRSLEMTFTGNGYVVLPGTTAFIAPTPAAQNLGLGDDNEVPVTLTNPLVYPGGVASQLFVHANGYVSVASNTTLSGPNFIPEPAVMLNAPATAWWSWHDYNPAEAGSGPVLFEEVGNLVLVTWDGVESYPTTAVNPSTFQFQFDTTTGNARIVWQSIDPVGGSGFLQGDDHLIGFSPGGPSPNPGPFDITTFTSLVVQVPEQFALKLATTSTPLLGSTVTLVTSNETGVGVGINFVSVVQIPAPGFDLGLIGAPGCAALIDVSAAVGNVISNIPGSGLSMGINFPLPNNPLFAGLNFYSQSIWLDPTANAFGAITSDAYRLTLGNY